MVAIVIFALFSTRRLEEVGKSTRLFGQRAGRATAILADQLAST